MNAKLYRHLAGRVQARADCLKTDNDEWVKRHGDAAEQLCKDHMPSLLGTIDLGRSKPQRLVFLTSFHEHDVIVTPCLYSGFNLRITGRDRNGTKDYLGQLFSEALGQEIEA